MFLAIGFGFILAIPIVGAFYGWGVLCRATEVSVCDDDDSDCDCSDDELHPVSKVVSLEAGHFYEVDSATIHKHLLDTPIKRPFLMIFHATWCRNCPAKIATLKNIASGLSVPVLSLEESHVDDVIGSALHIETVSAYPTVYLYTVAKRQGSSTVYEFVEYDEDDDMLKTPDMLEAFVQKHIL